MNPQLSNQKVYISYDHLHDNDCKNQLLIWNLNDEFQYSFYNNHIPEPVHSREAALIRHEIINKISKADTFLCLIGKYTSASEWAAWEIDTARAYEKNIIVVKINPLYKPPRNIIGVGASWALGFSYYAIKYAILSSKEMQRNLSMKNTNQFM